MTDEKVIDAFGGTSQLAYILQLDRRVVFNWRTRGIPKPWRIIIAQYANGHGVKIPKDFLGKRK